MAEQKKSNNNKNNNKKKKTNNRAQQIKKGFNTTKSLTITIIVVFLLTFAVLGIYYAITGTLPFVPKGSNGNKTSITESSVPLETSTQSPSTSTASTNPSTNGIAERIVYDDFQIHFMQLGNSKAGDSVYIKAGSNDILIDAGSTSGSYDTVSAYLKEKNLVTDKKFEYVIATHGDADHIEAFPKYATNFDFGTIITNRYSSKTTQTYQNMVTAFENKVANGSKWSYADECWNNTNGASRQYKLSDNVTMDILYNYYYFDNDNNGKGDTSDENDYSVCTLFTYKKSETEKYSYLLTGDLEEKGEKKLAAYYDKSTPEKTLPHCDVFKAGHHGSPTSSNDCLLSLITPEICVVSCCAGTAEYTINADNQFPSQEFINNIAKYTDKVYVTSMISLNATKNEWEYKAMNGTMIVSTSSQGRGLKSVIDNYTKLKDSAWFNETIYTVGGNNLATKGKIKGTIDFYTATTSNAVARPRRVWPSA